MMAGLPADFLRRMRELLGEDYEPFLAGFGGERRRGLRVNTLKIELEEFERIAPFHLKKIPWIDNGYFYEEDDCPARHPFYAAGLYYLQEPSAMAPASRLDIKPGDKALDLCAAPGGKATALGAALRGQGLLVANEINAARAKALLRNIELFGVRNCFVTNEPPHILAEKYPEYFDKIMVDAPCSGEGMFRKNPAGAESSKEKGPAWFSAIQKELILHAADMLKPGGQMLYSTCTFAPEENEGTVTHLLFRRPEMEVIPMEDFEGFAEGILAFEGENFHESCRLCRRLWPHKMAGEGHFMALLRKKPVQAERDFGFFADGKGRIRGDVRERKKAGKRQKGGGKAGRPGSSQGWWEQVRGIGREQRTALREFFGRMGLDMDAERVDIRGNRVYYMPEIRNDGKKIHFLRNGVYVGDLKKKRFEPSQPFALALSPGSCAKTIRLDPEDERLLLYLRGESIDVGDIIEQMAGENRPAENGWYLLLAAEYPLGFGKLIKSTLKNKYPPGWREKY